MGIYLCNYVVISKNIFSYIFCSIQWLTLDRIGNHLDEENHQQQRRKILFGDFTLIFRINFKPPARTDTTKPVKNSACTEFN